jgi:hypothetical protein
MTLRHVSAIAALRSPIAGDHSEFALEFLWTLSLVAGSCVMFYFFPFRFATRSGPSIFSYIAMNFFAGTRLIA